MNSKTDKGSSEDDYEKLFSSARENSVTDGSDFDLDDGEPGFEVEKPQKKRKKIVKVIKKPSGKSDVVKKEDEEWSKEREKKVVTGKMRTTIIKMSVIMIVIIVITAATLVYLYYEAFDTDSDGILNWDDDDDDGDGMPDSWEEEYGFDPLNSKDAKKDADSDNLTNKLEYVHKTDPYNRDSDSDGLEDGSEIEYRTDPLLYDSDSDGLPDGWEVKYQLDPMDESDADSDSDNDGYSYTLLEKYYYFNYTNKHEFENNTNPIEPDTDSDLIYDGWELYWNSEVEKIKEFEPGFNYSFDPLEKSDGELDIDLDSSYNIVGDGLKNSEEFFNGTNPLKPDSDSDDLNDGDEIKLHKTDPNWYDSDNDLLSDGWEVAFGLNPLSTDTDSNSINDSQEDKDEDGLTNLQEYVVGSNPHLNDTDLDGMLDGWEIDFSLDPLQPDHLDDYDNDSLSNGLEELYGTDPQNPDSDSDSLTDGEEAVIGWYGYLINGVFITNNSVPKYFTNPLKKDTDSDGLSDSIEIKFYHSNATSIDSDLDTLLDYNETEIGTNASRADSDSDGLNDTDELNGVYGYLTFPTIADSDNDGLMDGEEIFTDFYPGTPEVDGTDPTTNDTDSDDLPDGWEAEYGKTTDYDLIKRFDTDHGTNLLNIADPNSDKEVEIPVWLINPLDGSDDKFDPDHDGYDNDGDGIVEESEYYSNLMEYQEYSKKYGKKNKFTDPLNWDSDNDFMSDGWEFRFGKDAGTPDPLDGSDAYKDPDKDGVKYYIDQTQYSDEFTNLEEYLWGTDLDDDGIIDAKTTNPNRHDSDNDGDLDYEEIWFSDYDCDGLYTGWELLFNGSTIYAPNGYKPHFVGGFDNYKGKFNPYNNNSDDTGDLDQDEDYDGDDITNIKEHKDPRAYPGSSDPTDKNSARGKIEGRSLKEKSEGQKIVQKPVTKDNILFFEVIKYKCIPTGKKELIYFLREISIIDISKSDKLVIY